MEIVALALVGIGGLLMFVGSIWLLIVAFQESVLWGLGCILIPFVSLAFVIMHWGVSMKPFLISLGGFVLFIAGGVLGGIPLEEVAN